MIARNEGERLVRCLESLPRLGESVVYVDSGSTDGSVERARLMGVSVVELDMSIPFSAARSRNAGFARVMALDPELRFIQFVDGDCSIQSDWIETALAFLESHPSYAVVCGRRREMYPTSSVYNQLTDFEWDLPEGDTTSCGGDALMRCEVFQAVGGFNPSLIAGEEPDLCLRIRQQGHGIRRLACEMTLHDAAIHRFPQWWARMVRSGHAYSELATLHRAKPGMPWLRDVASIAFWGAFLPLLFLASLAAPWYWSLAVLGSYFLLGGRIYRRRTADGRDTRGARVFSFYCVLGKIAGAQGLFLYVWNRFVKGEGSEPIEYKRERSRNTVMIFGSLRYDGVPCGISSAVRTLESSPLREHFRLVVISTFRSAKPDRGISRRLLFGVFLLLRSAFRILAERAQIVDIHVASDRDFLKHTAVVFAGRLTRRPVLLRIHGGDFDRVYENSSARMQRFTRWILRSSSVVVLLSESWAEIVSKIEPLAATRVLPNPISCDEFESIGRQRVGGGQTVLMLGNLCERKGHFDALEAAKLVNQRLPETIFEFAGAERDSGARSMLAERVEKLGLQEVTRFLGPVSGEAKDAAFARAALFILPSHTENMPLSITEAMAAGLAVVATSVGAIPDLVEDGETGLLVDPRCPEALAERILSLLNDPELRRTMGERAQIAARRTFDQRVIAERSEALYDSLLRGSAL